ncbi:MAG: hypothetical protein ABSA75_15340 [Candidatus Bathyarchaeia archaeon]|jgi:hypothetical protein
MLSKKNILILVILIAVALNAICFCVAYPETFKPESSTLARDFSAYYIGEWRLFHNPTEVYAGGAQPGDYQILPNPQTFKYAPSFLILFASFLSLSYQNSLVAFNAVQLALVPVLAFFVYKIVKGKNLAIAAVAAIIILIEPLPTPPIEQSAVSFLHNQFFSLNPQSFAPSYAVGYVVVNAHILQTILIVGALYLGFSKRPWLSALLFAFGSFDPRAALFALPLLLWYNRQTIRQFIVGMVAFLLATNLPFFFYYGIGFTFLRTEISGNIISQMYQYDWIPLYSIAILSIVEIITSDRNAKTPFSFPLTRKAEKIETTEKE